MFPATSSRRRLTLSAALLVVSVLLVGLGSGILAGSALHDGALLVAAIWVVVGVGLVAGETFVFGLVIDKIRMIDGAAGAAS